MDDYERGRADERADVIKFMRDVEVMHRYVSENVKGEKLAGRHHARAMECCVDALKAMSHMPHRIYDPEWEGQLAKAKAWHKAKISPQT